MNNGNVVELILVVKKVIIKLFNDKVKVNKVVLKIVD